MTASKATAIVVGVTGFALVWWQAGWIAALGLALAMTGNNLERSIRRIGEP